MITIPISVLIVTYNRNKYLKECLASVFSQNYLPNEIVIIDNAKNVQTKKLVNCYRNKGINILYYGANSNNVPRARNKATRVARNNFVAFLDDDCIASKNWLKIGFIVLKKDSHFFYYGKNMNIDNENKISMYEYKKTEQFFSQFRRETGKMITSFLLDTKNCVFDKRILLEKKVKFDEQFQRLEDIDMSYALAQKNISIQYIAEMKVKHHYKKEIIANMYNYFQIGLYSAKLREKWAKSQIFPFLRKKTVPFPLMFVDTEQIVYEFFSWIFSYLGYFFPI